ncbi:MAG: LapA family protein [Anaerolineales bacterium]
MIVSLILTLVAVILAVMIALENTTLVQVTFFGYGVQGAVGLFLLIALGVGVVLGILLMLPALIGHSLTAMQSKRKIAQLEYKPPRKKASK